MSRKTYYKNGDGFIMNQFYKDGSPVKLHPRQAKYLIAPLGTELRTMQAVLSNKPAPLKKKAKVEAETDA